MKWEVKLFDGGNVFNEEVVSANRDDALTTAKARNPTAKVMGVNPVIRS